MYVVMLTVCVACDWLFCCAGFAFTVSAVGWSDDDKYALLTGEEDSLVQSLILNNQWSYTMDCQLVEVRQISCVVIATSPARILASGEYEIIVFG